MRKPIKILVVAAEASGDRLAALALEHAKMLAATRGDTLELFGIGGSCCNNLGMTFLRSAEEMSVVGFWEVAKRYAFFKRALSELISILDSSTGCPDIVFLIDYPGFNLRLAREAHRRGIRVVFYVSPQVWAWKASRVKEIVQNVDDMLVIFPFEVDIYRKAGLRTTYFVGHPLLEITESEKQSFSAREDFAKKFGLDYSKRWLLVFPGSRSEEVQRHLDIMTKAAMRFSATHDWQPILVESESVAHTAYATTESFPIKHFRSAANVHELMAHGHLGILKSGTTTLEAAIMGLPGVICYKTSPLTFAIAKRMIKLKFIGLANIVFGKKLYPELIQSDFSELNIVDNLESVNDDRNVFCENLREIRNILHSPNDSPSRRVAEILLGNA